MFSMRPRVRWRCCGRHRIELVEAIDEPLLLGLRQAVKTGLVTQCVFLANKRFALMTLEPASEVRAVRIPLRAVGTLHRIHATRSICGRRTRRNGRGRKAIGRARVGTRRIARPGRAAVCRATAVGGCAITLARGLHRVRSRHVRLRHMRRGRMRTPAVTGVLCIYGQKSGDADQRCLQQKRGCAAHETTRRRHTGAPGRSEAGGRAVRSFCAAPVPRHGSVSF